MSLTPLDQLAERIRARDCRYGVMGAGYVGLPLAVAFARRGVRVTCFEVDEAKVAAIRLGRSYVGDVSDADVAACVKAGTLTATLDMAQLAEMDVVSICVPTPLSKSQDPDVSYVDAATRSLEWCCGPGNS